jgi:SRSO17 transposase
MNGPRDWESARQTWLEPVLAHLGHPARRRMCPLYVAGLIGPGERKSLQPIAARLAPTDYDQLHHFVAVGPWEEAPLATELLIQADRLVGGPDAMLVIDDTALPKKGTLSVGVARQYASALGKRANCQTLVSLTLAKNQVPVPIALRLFLPESWTNDPERMQRAGVPELFQAPRTKPEIAVSELDRIIAAGVRFGCVLADAGYGISAAFRQALSARGLVWAVGIPRIQKVFRADVEMIWPTGVGAHARPPFPAPRQSRRRTCWPVRDGSASSGGTAPKVRSGPSLRPGACAWQTALRCASAGGPASTFQARRSGWWASGAQAGSASTIYPTCRPRRT